MQSLKKQNHTLSTPEGQIDLLSDAATLEIPTFDGKLSDLGHPTLKPKGIDIFQVNVGKMCNQVCAHCHVDAGPDRKEIMTKDTMRQCIDAIKNTSITTVDLTGGAPEMNPNFRWFVDELRAIGKEVIVRCNLTIILANPKYHDLPEFFKKHKVNVVSSLPYFTAKRTDAQRGDGVFDKSIKALQMLNEVGYGKADSDLQLDLVYNPAGAFLPGDQQALESQFKSKLLEYDIVFNNLFAITNLPVSRFLEYLVRSGKYEDYMEELVNAFNPMAAESVMCRSTISVGWDGYLYDCDFNQMLELKVKESNHVSDFNIVELTQRDIIVNQHCYGCTAGAGSSCGGTTV
ncbi:MAG: arsenosugar biosynthesis radical SAM (seleno)protein ArsS [Cyclobacteriaceae bacterium]